MHCGSELQRSHIPVAWLQIGVAPVQLAEEHMGGAASAPPSPPSLVPPSPGSWPFRKQRLSPYFGLSAQV
jgi:hypothetical protein